MSAAFSLAFGSTSPLFIISDTTDLAASGVNPSRASSSVTPFDSMTLDGCCWIPLLYLTFSNSSPLFRGFGKSMLSTMSLATFFCLSVAMMV